MTTDVETAFRKLNYTIAVEGVLAFLEVSIPGTHGSPTDLQSSNKMNEFLEAVTVRMVG